MYATRSERAQANSQQAIAQQQRLLTVARDYGESWTHYEVAGRSSARSGGSVVTGAGVMGAQRRAWAAGPIALDSAACAPPAFAAQFPDASLWLRFASPTTIGAGVRLHRGLNRGHGVR